MEVYDERDMKTEMRQYISFLSGVHRFYHEIDVIIR